MHLTVAAIVVAYHPQEEQLFYGIHSYYDAVDKILLWRNSSEELTIPEDLSEKIIIVGDETNDYMAHPLNFALSWCANNGYDYLLTMDQDSRWINVDHFISKATIAIDKDVAIYAPYIIGQYAKPDKDYDAESVITSGSLVNVSIARNLGGFREDYKIYWVDGEFCYWARANGYRVRVLHDCQLQQQFGNQTKTVFGFTTSNYSATVYYYLIRNMFWMRREFPDGVSVKTILYTLMYNLRGIILGEKNKLSKIHHINKGIAHGLFSRIMRRPAIL